MTLPRQDASKGRERGLWTGGRFTQFVRVSAVACALLECFRC